MTHSATTSGGRPFSAGRFAARFLLFVAAFIGAVMAIHFLSGGAALDALLGVTAWAAAGVLQVVGVDVVREGTILHASGFSAGVVPGCDPVQPFILMSAAILASPRALRSRLIGFAIVIPFVTLVNIGRVASLVVIRGRSADAYEVIHTDVWPILFLVIVGGAWLLWLRWTRHAR